MSDHDTQEINFEKSNNVIFLFFCYKKLHVFLLQHKVRKSEFI